MSVLPRHLQPGNVQIAVPQPAQRPAEYYITSPEYMGFSITPTNPMVVTAEDGEVSYQFRDGKLARIPDLQADLLLRDASRYIGAFVLIGMVSTIANQRRYLSRTQAVTENGPDAKVRINFDFIYCLFAEGQDLTHHRKTYRLTALENTVYWLIAHGGQDYFHSIPSFSTTREKRYLYTNNLHTVFERWSKTYRELTEPEALVWIPKP